MALRNILTQEEPALRKTSRPVTKFDERLHILLDDMQETLKKANGVGLAAPQIGVLRRVVVIDLEDQMLELINPEILEQEGEKECVEGCLSVPEKYGWVVRPTRAVIRAQDRNGNWFEKEGTEVYAQAFCHEVEHLDGHLYTEKMSRFLTDEELEELYGDKDEKK